MLNLHLSHLRRGLLVVAIMCFFACGGSTEIQDETCQTSSVPMCQNAASRQLVTLAVLDAETRSAAALTNQSTRLALGEPLAELGAALSAGNVTRVRAAVRDVSTEIERARQSTATLADAPDLAAIELAVKQASLLI